MDVWAPSGCVCASGFSPFFISSVSCCTIATHFVMPQTIVFSHSLHRAGLAHDRPTTVGRRNRLEEEYYYIHSMIRHCVYTCARVCAAHHFHREKRFFSYFVPVGGSRAVTSPLTKATVLTGYCPGNSAGAHYIHIMYRYLPILCSLAAALFRYIVWICQYI